MNMPTGKDEGCYACSYKTCRRGFFLLGFTGKVGWPHSSWFCFLFPLLFCNGVLLCETPANSSKQSTQLRGGKKGNK